MFQEIPLPQSKLFECLWVFKDHQAKKHLIAADACSDIILKIDGQKINYSLSCHQLSTIYDTQHSNSIYYGLRLHPAALNDFLQISADSCVDRHIDGSAFKQLSKLYPYFIQWHETSSPKALLLYLRKWEENHRYHQPLETLLIRNCWQQYTLDHIIHQSGYTARHFRRKIKQQIGCSPYHLYRIFRMRRAISLKSQGDLSDIHIALSCGFSDQSHMLNDIYKLSGEKFSCWK